MQIHTRSLATLIVAAAVLWHLLAVLTPAWPTVAVRPSKGRDFASYYYAVQVAADGGDPWARQALGALSREEGERRGVHPYLYPPPFLLIMAWAIPLDLMGAYRLWFWLDELWAAAAFFALWRWWRPLGSAVPVALAVAVAANTSIPANHVMGQANFPGLTLAILALWQADQRRPVLSGVLMGAACMVKMSPALFVFWWVVRRDWVPAIVACVTAVALSVAALPLVGVDAQLGFYTRVLPSFSSGDYNGLTVPIDMFGNHSIPNLWAQVFPGSGRLLSDTARRASSLSTLTLVLGLGWLFRKRGADLMQRGAQASAFGVALLLVPVYTYEHHCVWALPAVVMSIVALAEGRLAPRWAVPLALATTVWAFEILDLRRAFESIEDLAPWTALALQELKFLALLTFLTATAVVGAFPADAVGVAPREAAA